jgi:hypothetical protein
VRCTQVGERDDDHALCVLGLDVANDPAHIARCCQGIFAGITKAGRAGGGPARGLMVDGATERLASGFTRLPLNADFFAPERLLVGMTVPH